MPTVTTHIQVHNICTMRTHAHVTKYESSPHLCVRDIMLVDTDGKATLISIYTHNEADLAFLET